MCFSIWRFEELDICLDLKAFLIAVLELAIAFNSFLYGLD